jgi:hypothetical protein
MTPDEMLKIVDRLKAEGRLPNRDEFLEAVTEIVGKYRRMEPEPELPQEPEAPFRCVSCDRGTDDGLILRDGRFVCMACAMLWETDSAKHN